MPFRYLVLFLSLLCACRAAEVVAWKVPLENYCGSGFRSKGLLRLESPPEPSVFFNKGDELWDVSKAEDAKTAKLDWVVWNATSCRLVGKGGTGQLELLHLRMAENKVPVRIRHLFEVFRASPERSFVGNGDPELSLMTHSSSSRLFEGQVENRNGTLSVRGESYFGRDFRTELARTDLRLEVSCRLAGQSDFVVDTGVALWSGKPLWIAGDWTGDYGADLRVTATVELTDGTPWQDLVLKQTGKLAQRVDLEIKEFGPIKAGDGFLSARWVTKQGFEVILGPAKDGNPMLSPEVDAPAFLNHWIQRPVRKMDDILRNVGIAVPEGGFSGYDPERQMAYLYSPSPEDHENFASLFIACVTPPPVPIRCSLDGPRRASLIVTSGQIGWLRRKMGGKEISVTEVEPFVMDDEPVETRIRHSSVGAVIDTHVVLKRGMFTTISETQHAPPFRLKAEVESGER